MKRNIIILILLLLNTFICVKYFILKDKHQLCEKKQEISKLLDNKLNELFSESISNESIYINPNIEVTNILGLKQSLSSIFNSEFKIVIRSSEKGCGMCIEEELLRIKESFDSTLYKNIIVITTHTSARKLEIFKQTNKIPFAIYSCSNLGLPFEQKSEGTYVFMMDSTMRVKYFFHPEFSLPELSKLYYSAIIRQKKNIWKSDN